MIEYKTFPAEFHEIKAEEDDEMEFEGYASTFTDVPDSYNEVIKKGAFKKTIRERFKKGKGSLIKVFRGHRDIIGLPIEMKEDNTGLFTRSRVSKTQMGLDTMTLIRDDVLDRMSIGFNTVKYDRDNETGITTIKEIKLYEYGPVSFPANESAAITGHKAISLLQDSEVIATLKLLGDPSIKEALLLLTSKGIIDSTDVTDIESDTPKDEKILNAISAMRETATALERLLSPEPNNSTQKTEPDNSTSIEPEEDTLDKKEEVNPAILQSMLNEMQDITKELTN